jgi:Phosphoenolpyruvate phosphomutase
MTRSQLGLWPPAATRCANSWTRQRQRLRSDWQVLRRDHGPLSRTSTERQRPHLTYRAANSVQLQCAGYAHAAWACQRAIPGCPKPACPLSCERSLNIVAVASIIVLVAWESLPACLPQQALQCRQCPIGHGQSTPSGQHLTRAVAAPQLQPRSSLSQTLSRAQAGFVSGAAVSATLLGEPDVGLLTPPEMARKCNQICNSNPGLHVIADADTGGGNALNVQRTVRQLIANGCKGCILEDQARAAPWPRCARSRTDRVLSSSGQRAAKCACSSTPLRRDLLRAIRPLAQSCRFLLLFTSPAEHHIASRTARKPSRRTDRVHRCGQRSRATSRRRASRAWRSSRPASPPRALRSAKPTFSSSHAPTRAARAPSTASRTRSRARTSTSTRARTRASLRARAARTSCRRSRSTRRGARPFIKACLVQAPLSSDRLVAGACATQTSETHVHSDESHDACIWRNCGWRCSGVAMLPNAPCCNVGWQPRAGGCRSASARAASRRCTHTSSSRRWAFSSCAHFLTVALATSLTISPALMCQDWTQSYAMSPALSVAQACASGAHV